MAFLPVRQESVFELSMALLKCILAMKILTYFRIVHSNLIITKSMIRSPEDNVEYRKFNIVKNRTHDNHLYQIVTPNNFTNDSSDYLIKYEEGRAFSSRKFDKETIDTAEEERKCANVSENSEDIDGKNHLNYSISKFNNNMNNNNSSETSKINIEHNNSGLDDIRNSLILNNGNSTIKQVGANGGVTRNVERGRQQRSSLGGLNKIYWDNLRNLSYNYLQNAHTVESDNSSRRDETMHVDGSIQSANRSLWDLLLAVYYCFCRTEFVKCVSENLDINYQAGQEENEGFLLNFPLGSSEDVSGGAERTSDFDETEGRKKLTKKLFLPLLLVFKALVLPSLAGLALVTGKALLVSILSLIVSAFAAVTARYTVPFQDNLKKRQEIEQPINEYGQHYFM